MRWYLTAMALAVPLLATAQFHPANEPVAPDGTKAVCDLPPDLHIRNTGGMGRGGPGTGSGLCVFTSVEVASRWQNIPELTGFQKWMTYKEGGGWPQKLDKMIAQFCKEKGVAVPQYIQHTGGNADFLDLCIKTDRMVCVTYAGSDDFYRGAIAHMLVLAHIDQKWAAIYDNNRPTKTVWMSRSDFLKRWRAMGGGWAVVFLQSPPPPHIALSPTQFCPNGRCSPLPSVPFRPQVNNGPIGGPPTADHEWGKFDDGRWGWKLKDKQKPVEPMQQPQPAEGPVEEQVEIENYGVELDKIHAEERYSLSDGSRITKGRAYGMLVGDNIADDSDRFHLSIVGDASFQTKVKEHLSKVKPEVRAKLHIQFYTPDRWEVRQFKLPNGLSLRKPSPVRASEEIGTVKVEDYSLDSLLQLLNLIDGLTRPKPIPQPQPLPQPQPAPSPDNPSPPAPQPLPAPDNEPNWLAILITAGLALLWYFSNRKDKK